MNADTPPAARRLSEYMDFNNVGVYTSDSSMQLYLWWAVLLNSPSPRIAKEIEVMRSYILEVKLRMLDADSAVANMRVMAGTVQGIVSTRLQPGMNALLPDSAFANQTRLTLPVVIPALLMAGDATILAASLQAIGLASLKRAPVFPPSNVRAYRHPDTAYGHPMVVIAYGELLYNMTEAWWGINSSSLNQTAGACPIIDVGFDTTITSEPPQLAYFNFTGLSPAICPQLLRMGTRGSMRLHHAVLLLANEEPPVVNAGSSSVWLPAGITLSQLTGAVR